LRWAGALKVLFGFGARSLHQFGKCELRVIKNLQASSTIDHKTGASGKAHGGCTGLNGSGSVVDMANAFKRNGGCSFLIKFSASTRYER
jgi:hypothetical protein